MAAGSSRPALSSALGGQLTRRKPEARTERRNRGSLCARRSPWAGPRAGEPQLPPRAPQQVPAAPAPRLGRGGTTWLLGSPPPGVPGPYGSGGVKTTGIGPPSHAQSPAALVGAHGGQWSGEVSHHELPI